MNIRDQSALITIVTSFEFYALLAHKHEHLRREDHFSRINNAATAANHCPKVRNIAFAIAASFILYLKHGYQAIVGQLQANDP